MKCTEIIKEYTDKQTLIDLKNQLTAAGYKSIGKGIDAIVFTKKDDTDVVKVFIGEKDRKTDSAAAGFLAMAKFSKENPNIHLPKFGPIEKRKFGTEELYQVNMEKLHKLNDLEWTLVYAMTRAAMYNQSYEDVIKTLENHGSKALPKYQTEVQKEKKKLLQLAEKNKNLFSLMQQLHTISKDSDLEFDLLNEQGHNVMKRKDGTLVIVDPFAF
jgi:predicted O-linked N-acetylglucosamine transferase (SPINDLY family)